MCNMKRLWRVRERKTVRVSAGAGRGQREIDRNKMGDKRTIAKQTQGETGRIRGRAGMGREGGRGTGNKID